ncbi:DsbA family protein [Colwelliaceae bacterium 6441]
MNKPIIVEYYTDVLCVWAWISQQRIARLQQALGAEVDIQFRYVDVFGDTQTKMQKQWFDRGLYQGFSEHVRHCANQYPEAQVNPTIWSEVQPTTSTNAHLVLKAIELAYSSQKSSEMALVFRQAFYTNALDISDLNILNQLLIQKNLDATLIKSHIDNGTAIAALMADYQEAKQQALKGSPTYIIDNGRQVLYGNVSYSVLLANVKAHLVSESALT